MVGKYLAETHSGNKRPISEGYLADSEIRVTTKRVSEIDLIVGVLDRLAAGGDCLERKLMINK